MKPVLLRQLRDSAFELRDRVAELLLPHLMRRQRELALHLRASQPARFELAHEFGIAAGTGLARLAFLLFAFFHSLGETRFGVDEPFSSVSHPPDYTDQRPAPALSRLPSGNPPGLPSLYRIGS